MSTKPLSGTEITITNGDVLSGLLALAEVKPTNALGSVKLGRLRKALSAEADPVIAAFDEMGQKYAKKGADGKAEVAKNEAGESFAWKVTGTPMYVLKDTDGFNAENASLAAAEVTIRVPLLTELDLAHMTVGDDVGLALLPFVDGI